MRVYTGFQGGLGDTFSEYHGHLHEAGYWRDLKRRHPDIHIDLIFCHVNAGVTDFFKFNPWIDEFHYMTYNVPFKPILDEHARRIGSVQLRHEFPNLREDYRWEKPEIYLAPEEYRFVQDLEKGLCYRWVVLHPFAGVRDQRSMVGKVDLPLLADAIIDHGYNLIVLGGSSERHHFGRSDHLEESWTYERPGLTNLVGSQSIRVQAYFASKALAFVGTNSCYWCMSLANRVRTLAFVPWHLRVNADWCDLPVWKLARKNRNKWLYFEELYRLDLPRFVRAFLDNRDDFPFDVAPLGLPEVTDLDEPHEPLSP